MVTALVVFSHINYFWQFDSYIIKITTVGSNQMENITIIILKGFGPAPVAKLLFD